ncbi:MAG: hypothetical protein V3V00_06695 [Saprospiraceae bacterium]
MRKIRGIVYLLESVMGYKKKHWAQFQSYLPPLESELLNFVLNDKEITDESAANSLFRTDIKDPNFGRLKNKLRHFLFIEIFRFSPSGSSYTPYQKAHYASEQMLAIFKILKGVAYTSLAKPLADKLHAKSQSYHFNEIGLEASRYLFYYYSVIQTDLTNSEKFSKEIKKYNNIVQYEIEAECKFYTILTKQLLAKEKTSDIAALARSYYYKLTSYAVQKLPSSKFYLFYYRLGGLIYEVEGNYKKAIIYAREGYTYFKNQSYDHRTAKIIFMLSMAFCYLRLGFLLEARQIITRSLLLQFKGRNNWFVSKRLLMQIECHKKNYQDAYDHYRDITTHRKFPDLRDNYKAFYLLNGAYFDFLALTGRMPDTPPPSRRSISSTFQNILQKDISNRHIKIPLIIAQLLYNVYDRDYDAIENRIYSLKSYCNRNLMRKSPNFRSNCFIKMLLVIPSNNFNAIAVRRKTKKYLERLRSVPFTVSEHPSEVEVLPYEDLWEMVLEELRAPKRRRNVNQVNRE